jgi:serine/threonine protein kinase
VVGNIGGGGQGDVFRVVDATQEIDGERALKRLRRKDRKEGFRREVEILRRLSHDNIIKIVDARIQESGGDEASFLVMPVALHGDLSARLDIYRGHIDPIIEVAKQIASALQFAHSSKIIHRDIKPGNILFPEVGHKVWVADFGLSIDQTAERLTPDGEVVGARFFTAPELDEGGSVEVTPAADIFSLGQLLFFMLSGGKRVPYDNVLADRHASLFSVGPRHALLRLLLSKMIVRLDNRYQDMQFVIRDLEQIEHWEKSIAGGLLDAKGLEATARLQKRAAEEMERQVTFKATREGDLKLLNTAKESVMNWVELQLEAVKVQIAAGGALQAAVDKFNISRFRPIIIDTGNSTVLQEIGSIMLTIRVPSDTHRNVYGLRFLVCSEVRYTLSAEDHNYLGKPGNPMMAVVPMFAQFKEASPPTSMDDGGYYFGRPTKYGVPDPIPIMSNMPYHRQMFSQSYVDGNICQSRGLTRANGRLRSRTYKI